MRVVQLSDSHLSVSRGVPPTVQSLLDWIAADPPDLVVHTGDIVWFDPDDTLDRTIARRVLSTLPAHSAPGRTASSIPLPDRRAAAVRYGARAGGPRPRQYTK